MNLRLIFYLLFLLSLSGSSQNAVDNYLMVDDQAVLINIKNTLIYRSIKEKTIDTLEVFDGFESEIIRLVTSFNKPYVVSKSGGGIWSVDKSGLKRIDNSFDHKMTFGSNVFVHRDTIFKFGGYGYWSNRNFLTFFSTTTKEWEYYKVNTDSYLPPALSGARGVYHNGQLYLDGGFTVDSHDGFTAIPSNKVWCFDFLNKTWKDLGVTNFDVSKYSEYLDIGNGQVLIRNEDHNSTNGSYLLNYVSNTFSEIDPIPSYIRINNQLVANDSIYNLRRDKFFGVSLNNITYNKLSTKNLYLDSDSLFNNLTRVAGFTLIILVIILIYFYRKNRNRPRLTDTGIVVNREHYSLNPNECIILSLLLYNKNVTSKTIADKIRDPKRSTAQNNKIKLDLISSTDKKVSSAIGVKRFIHTRKSAKDKREIIYFTPNRKEFVL
tara:strand:- start:1199 stop:2503 length:1305 start_codon:yes stop_codon:yes gene_type:complete